MEEKMRHALMEESHAMRMPATDPPRRPTSYPVDRWVEEQMLEEDLRAVLRMIRPHGRERLSGWKEYRTGGAGFRVTVSWDPDTERPVEPLAVPNMTDVIEALLIGSAVDQDDLTAQEEFDQYRAVVAELGKRIDEMERCYT
jgi:hypothetical protein